jgi:hypothetical protein
MSIWEALLLIEKKKLEVHEDFRRWYARTAEDLALEEAAVTSKVVHEMRSILPHHRDPADRFLAATAITYDLVLVTADQELMAVPGLKVLANLRGLALRLGGSQVLSEEGSNALFGVGCGFRTVAVLIIGIFEGVARAAIDFDVGAFPAGFHGVLEGLNAFGRDALVFGAEISEHRGIDLGDDGLIGRK